MRLRPPGRAVALALVLLACSLVSATAASANLVPPATRPLPIRVPTMGNYSVGTGTLNVAYTDSDATATALAAAVALGPNNLFHVDTCVKVHSINKLFDTKCEQKTVDTRSNASPISVAAPTVTTRVDRPAPGGSAYFSSIVSVSSQQTDGSFKEMASTWPDSKLAGASVAVPALGAATASAPASEGMPLPLAPTKTGGLNTGQPDSMCSGVRYPDPDAPGSGVSTTGLGSGAPAYYEVGEPTGAYEGRSPKGVMLLIHGGGWFMNGPAMVAGERGHADRWRARGWRTLNVTYRPCGASFGDVVWFYDRARQLWGTTMPYCATGASAGGELALLLAASKQTLSCVVDEAGPTNGLTIKNQKTGNPDPTAAANGGPWVYNLMVAAVGPENVMWWSPAVFAQNLRNTRILFAVAANDWYIPYAQGTELRDKVKAAKANAYVDLYQLAAGSTPWVHANVSPGALQALYTREEQLVAPL